jgi:hypothetical protein
METTIGKPAPDKDARAQPRHRALLGATIVYGPDMLTVDCKIRDWSDNGVRVQLPTMVLLPEHFWIIEHRIAFAHEARLIWRKDDLVGLELLARRGLDPATDRNLKFLRRIWMEKLPRAAGETID